MAYLDNEDELLAAIVGILRDPAKASRLGIDNTLIGRTPTKDAVRHPHDDTHAIVSHAVIIHEELPHGGGATLDDVKDEIDKARVTAER